MASQESEKSNKNIDHAFVGQKIADFIRRGHELVQKMRSAQSLEELESLDPALTTYSDEFDDYFGGENGEPGGSSLSTALFVAYDWQKNRFYKPYDEGRDVLAESFTKDFEEELDSHEWWADFHPKYEAKND